jgi:hypothetical protein
MKSKRQKLTSGIFFSLDNTRGDFDNLPSLLQGHWQCLKTSVVATVQRDGGEDVTVWPIEGTKE